MQLELIRVYHTLGTNGVILLNGEKICAAIELPWKNNQPRISCIPEGKYTLIKRYSPRHGWHLQVMDVPGRQYILIHPANNAALELKGCIAPVAAHTGIGRGLQSRNALQKLKALVYPVLAKKQPVFLIIKTQFV
jgi:hypothetical protein